MKHSTRKKTISLLLIAALALNATLNKEETKPAILPDEFQLESLEELKDKNGKKRKLVK